MALFARELRQVSALKFNILELIYILTLAIYKSCLLIVFSFVPHMQRFHTTMEQTQEMFEYTSTFFQKLMTESKNAESRAAEANDSQINSIIDFQKTYEVMILHLFKFHTKRLCLIPSITDICCAGSVKI